MTNYSTYFTLELNTQQKKVFDALCSFITDADSKVFILKGYAGTGKTMLLGGFIKYLSKLQDFSSIQPKFFNEDDAESNEKSDIAHYAVLASTGRGAKILSDKTQATAKTVHSLIYRLTNLSDDIENHIKKEDGVMAPKGYKQLSLQFEPQQISSEKCNIYICDEASMIANKKHGGSSNANFGEGDLLGDLINFDLKAKFIFTGDPAQLPPIHQKESPALDKMTMQHYFPEQKVEEYTLTQIMRQDSDNDILQCAAKLRSVGERMKQSPQQKNETPSNAMPWEGIGKKISTQQAKFTPLPLSGYRSVRYIPQMQLINEYIEKVKKNGFEKATLLCHSNKECYEIGHYVRQQLFGEQQLLIKGDLLLVNQNNYLVDLVNGDLCVVMEVGDRVKRAGLTFVQVKVKELAGRQEYSLMLIEDLITNGQPNLNEEQHNELMIDFVLRMKSRHVEVYDTNKKNKLNPLFRTLLRQDPYMNALRATYGYALTCHKSQGGEWEEIYLYLGKSVYALRETQLFQWAYTAVTRAKEKLYYAGESYIFK